MITTMQLTGAANKLDIFVHILYIMSYTTCLYIVRRREKINFVHFVWIFTKNENNTRPHYKLTQHWNYQLNKRVSDPFVKYKYCGTCMVGVLPVLFFTCLLFSMSSSTQNALFISPYHQPLEPHEINIHMHLHANIDIQIHWNDETT